MHTSIRRLSHSDYFKLHGFSEWGESVLFVILLCSSLPDSTHEQNKGRTKFIFSTEKNHTQFKIILKLIGTTK